MGKNEAITNPNKRNTDHNSKETFSDFEQTNSVFKSFTVCSDMVTRTFIFKKCLLNKVLNKLKQLNFNYVALEDCLWLPSPITLKYFVSVCCCYSCCSFLPFVYCCRVAAGRKKAICAPPWRPSAVRSVPGPVMKPRQIYILYLCRL